MKVVFHSLQIHTLTYSLAQAHYKVKILGCVCLSDLGKAIACQSKRTHNWFDQIRAELLIHISRKLLKLQLLPSSLLKRQ